MSDLRLRSLRAFSRTPSLRAAARKHAASAATTAIEPAVAKHNDTVANGGLESLIPQLHPTLHWDAPVLSVDLPHIDRDLHLAEQSLIDPRGVF